MISSSLASWSARCCGSRAGPSTTPTTCGEEHGRAEGRRPSGLFRLARDHHDGALFRNPSARRTASRSSRMPSPNFHAIQYLLGKQTCEKTRELFAATRAPSPIPRATKDSDDVDFSTGSVGARRGAEPCFSSLVQDYVRAHGWGARSGGKGRMVALIGDAELDEGNIFECLLEGWKQGPAETAGGSSITTGKVLDAVIREGAVAALRGAVSQFSAGEGRDP